MGDELKKVIVTLVQAFLMISTWTYILVSYWNQTEPPGVIWGAAIALAALYGIALVGPAATKMLKGYYKEN